MTSARFDRPPFKGEIDEAFRGPEFESALSRLRELIEDPRAEVLLKGRNTVVALDLPLGRGALDLLRRQKLPRRGPPEAQDARRAVEGGQGLARSARPRGGRDRNARPLAYLERRSGGTVAESYFVAERVPGLPEIRALFRDPGPAGLRPLLDALAALGRIASTAPASSTATSRTATSSSGATDGAGSAFVYLDTNRVRVRKRLGASARARNLVRLGIPPADRMFFLERYAAARGEKLSPVFVHFYKEAKLAFATWLRVKKALRLKKAARALRIQ